MTSFRRVFVVGHRRPFRSLMVTELPKEEPGRRSQPTTGRERLETSRELKLPQRSGRVN